MCSLIVVLIRYVIHQAIALRFLVLLQQMRRRVPVDCRALTPAHDLVSLAVPRFERAAVELRKGAADTAKVMVMWNVTARLSLNLCVARVAETDPVCKFFGSRTRKTA